LINLGIKLHFLKYVPALFFTVLTVYFMLFRLPGDGLFALMKDIPHADKAIHFVWFGLLMLIWNISPLLHRQNQFSRTIFICCFCILFSGFMESLQIFTQSRSFEFLDIIANTVGILTITVYLLRSKKMKN